MEIFSTNPGLRLFAGGIIFLLFSVLLYSGRIKMNKIRINIPNAYTSEENWDKLNRYGGKAIIIWSIVVAVIGLILFPFSNTSAINTDLIMLSGIIPLIKIYFYAKRL